MKLREVGLLNVTNPSILQIPDIVKGTRGRRFIHFCVVQMEA